MALSNADAKKVRDDFLIEGAGQGVEGYTGNVNRLRSLAGDGGFGGAGGSSPLAQKMSRIASQRAADLEGSFERSMPLAYAGQNKGYQAVADRNAEVGRQEKALEDMIRRQREAKRKAFQGQVRGLLGMAAGAGIGGFAGGGGFNAANAGFGGQVGSGVGGLLG